MRWVVLGVVAGMVCLIGSPTMEARAQGQLLPGITVDAPKRAKRRVRVAVRRVTRTRTPVQAPAPLPAVPEQPRADVPLASASLLTAKQVLGRGAASLGDTLGTTPGVSATSFSPVASRPVIRGLGGFRVRTQENGIGSGDMANLGEDHAVTIDPLSAQNVEVIRGPGT
jgi:iron complex outermembrane receptor protein